MASNFIGAIITLTSVSDIRYVGRLHSIDHQESTISLENVSSRGTENRKPQNEYVPPNDRIYDFVVFRAKDVKDLAVEQAPPPVTTASVPDDPAIMGGTTQSRPAPHSPSNTQAYPHPASPYAQHPLGPGGPYGGYPMPAGRPPSGPPPGAAWGPPPPHGMYPPPPPPGPYGGYAMRPGYPPSPAGGSPLMPRGVNGAPVPSPQQPAPLPTSSAVPSGSTAASAAPAASAPATQNAPPSIPQATKPTAAEVSIPKSAPTSEQRKDVPAPPSGPRSQPPAPSSPAAEKTISEPKAENKSAASVPATAATPSGPSVPPALMQNAAQSNLDKIEQALGQMSMSAATGPVGPTPGNGLPSTPAALPHTRSGGGRKDGNNRGIRPPPPHHAFSNGGHPRGPPHAQSQSYQQPSGRTVIPAAEFDFAESNARFDKSSVAKEAGGVVDSDSDLDSDDSDDEEPADPSGRAAKPRRQSALSAGGGAAGANKAQFYDKTTSFFDSISSDLKPEADNGRPMNAGGQVRGRQWRDEERTRNMSTFGEVGGQVGFNGSGGFNQGGGRGNGYRGGRGGRGGGRGGRGGGSGWNGGGYERQYNPRDRYPQDIQYTQN
ncbi:Uncharacterized mRNA-associated protein RAP55 [Phaffia rhodozyma]|uniref:Uncharacterized mRNA-associated protein RAP55 n=1 Tax=Phaffia rhodozyma TaxID=264483 RepID=A0A0F7SN46_PHARH|nr:Uncharacterized mRNA-associated protein RAP55 [Phaffia rhodozyma]